MYVINGRPLDISLIMTLKCMKSSVHVLEPVSVSQNFMGNKSFLYTL